MSFPGCAFSARISAAGSPFTKRVLRQSDEASVREKTSFGMAPMLSATTGLSFIAMGVGQ